jgi:dual specificity phosphatase 3
LRALGVTHVLNAAQKANCQDPGYYVNTSAEYYRRFGIEYLGVPATDSLSFDLSQYFEKAASFIDTALHTDGKIILEKKNQISSLSLHLRLINICQLIDVLNSIMCILFFYVT